MKCGVRRFQSRFYDGSFDYINPDDINGADSVLLHFFHEHMKFFFIIHLRLRLRLERCTLSEITSTIFITYHIHKNIDKTLVTPEDPFEDQITKKD